MIPRGVDKTAVRPQPSRQAQQAAAATRGGFAAAGDSLRQQAADPAAAQSASIAAAEASRQAAEEARRAAEREARRARMAARREESLRRARMQGTGAVPAAGADVPAQATTRDAARQAAAGAGMAGRAGNAAATDAQGVARASRGERRTNRAAQETGPAFDKHALKARKRGEHADAASRGRHAR